MVDNWDAVWHFGSRIRLNPWAYVPMIIKTGERVSHGPTTVSLWISFTFLIDDLSARWCFCTIWARARLWQAGASTLRVCAKLLRLIPGNQTWR